MYMGGEDWAVMRLCEHVCMPELTYCSHSVVFHDTSVAYVQKLAAIRVDFE